MSHGPRSKFLIIEKQEHRSDSLPPGTRLVAKAEDLDDLLATLSAKCGLVADGGDRDGKSP